LRESADNPRLVETVPRIGYRFVAPVSVSRVSIAANVEPQDVAAPAGEGSVDSLDSGRRSTKPDLASRNCARRCCTGFSPSARSGCIGSAVALVTVGFVVRMRFKSAVSARHPALFRQSPRCLCGTCQPTLPRSIFADGMTDEIITDLAELAGPKVISRTSALQYRGHTRASLRIEWATIWAGFSNVTLNVERTWIRKGGRPLGMARPDSHWLSKQPIRL